jgi:hypothetical protein
MIFTLIFSLLAQAESLDGIWRQDCHGAYQKEERIRLPEITLVETNFVDRECLQPGIEIHSSGTMLLGAPAMIPAGANELDFTFSKVVVVLRHENYRVYFNAKKACGSDSWELNEPRDVTGQSCGIFRAPPAGEMRYGIYQLKESELFFGKLTPEFHAKSPEFRPRELDVKAFKRISH